MRCDNCGEKTNVATIDSKHRLLCDKCYYQAHPHKIDGEKCKDVIDSMYDKIKEC